MDRTVSKELKQFNKMSPKLRHDIIFEDASWEGLSKEGFNEFKRENLVECLITYRKGSEKQILAYLMSRGLNETDIIKDGKANQIILRGKQATMQHIAGVLDANAPDLISAPKNPYITNSGNVGNIKLSPQGVPFSAVLNVTVNLVEEACRSGRILTAEGFAESVYEKRLGKLTSGAELRETAVLHAIASNIEEQLAAEKTKKLGKLAHSNIEISKAGDKKI